VAGSTCERRNWPGLEFGWDVYADRVTRLQLPTTGGVVRRAKLNIRGEMKGDSSLNGTISGLSALSEKGPPQIVGLVRDST